MKKKIFLMLLTVLVGSFALTAGNVMIDIDKAANVTVKTGSGRTLDLTDGMNGFMDLTSATDLYLSIEANAGASIESVMKNQETSLKASGDGIYRVGIEDTGMMLQITTSGEASGGDVAKTVFITDFYAMGDGITGKPFSLFYKENQEDTEWKFLNYDYANYSYTIPDGATIKVTPGSTHVVDNLTLRNGTQVETQTLEDGSRTFVCDFDKFNYQAIYVYMSLSPNAVSYTVTVDNKANCYAMLENGRGQDATYQTVSLQDGVNKLVCLKSNAPIEFFATNGAKILSVSLNDNEVSEMPASGWVYDINNGDRFVITTRGKEVDVKLTSGATDAPLDAYIYKTADGREFFPKGHEDVIKACIGDQVNVTPRTGATINSIKTTNGGLTDFMTFFKVAEGADYINPMQVTISGTISSVISFTVDAADRVVVKQKGGRGDRLALTDGENIISTEDFTNSLAISAAQDCQIVSVIYNDRSVASNAEGLYTIEAKEGDRIVVTSRRRPVDVTVNFMGEISGLEGKLDGTDVEITNPMTIRTYAHLLLKGRSGYILQGLIAKEKDAVTIEKDEAAGGYVVTVTDASVNSINLAPTIVEQTPEAGNSIVVPGGDPLFITFWEVTKTPVPDRDPIDGEYYYVKKLDNNTVAEVKTGDYVRIYNKDSQARFREIKVNGLDIDFDESARAVYVLVDGRTEISVSTWTPLNVYTNPSFDETKNVQSGNVYFEVDGENVTTLNVEKGQSLKLVAVPEKGYKFDHFEKFYPTDTPEQGTRVDADYTISELDCTYEFVLFKGVFVVNEDEKSYKVCGTTAWLCDSEGNLAGTGTVAAVGRVVFQWSDGSYHDQYLGYEGDVLPLFVAGNEESFVDKYEVNWYCFMDGFPNNRITEPGSTEKETYTINPADANENGEIWISAVIKTKGESGLQAVESDKLAYDAVAAKLTAPGTIAVYDMKGHKVSGGEGRADVSMLENGLYIAVSGSRTIKFSR